MFVGIPSSTAPIYRVQVLDRAFDVLDTLAENGGEMAAAELASRLSLNKSTVHRLLSVLQERRYLERNAANGKYHLGWRLYELGSLAVSRVNLYDISRPYIEQLVKDTGETAHLGVLRGDEIISLVNVESSRTVRTPSTVGKRNPIYCTSLGKAILANLPAAIQEKLIGEIRFKRFTKKTCTDASCLRKDLSTIRRRGHAIDDEEFEDGLRCVAVPIWDHSEQVAAAVSIAGPSYRVGGAHLPRLVRLVVRTARELSSAMGSRKFDK